MSNPYEPPRAPRLSAETNDGSGKATASLVLGLLSIVAWIIPLFGLPMTITGLVLGIKGLGPHSRTRAAVGIVLCALLIITIINAGLGAYLGFMGQHPLFPRR